jgi:hypothetical protein
MDGVPVDEIMQFPPLGPPRDPIVDYNKIASHGLITTLRYVYIPHEESKGMFMVTKVGGVSYEMDYYPPDVSETTDSLPIDRVHVHFHAEDTGGMLYKAKPVGRNGDVGLEWTTLITKEELKGSASEMSTVRDWKPNDVEAYRRIASLEYSTKLFQTFLSEVMLIIKDQAENNLFD